MKKLIFYISSLAIALSIVSCDDGSIIKEDQISTEGKVVKVEGTITGLRTWSNRYEVAIAGFSEAASSEYMPYADISKVMTADANGHVSIVLSNISGTVSTVEICALNRLRQRIVTFSSLDISNESGSDTIRYDIGTLDVSMFAGIQTGLFNATCTACHGNTGTSAAGLNLTADSSYVNLVNHKSTMLPDMNRVTPGDTANSVLWQVIDGNASESWPMNHGDMINKEQAAGILLMIEDWIKDGAKH